MKRLNRAGRYAAALFTAFACLWGPAHAGDIAERQMLGFSADGRYFAFEQFGIEDGSGFPYAQISVIDLKSGRPAQDTPVHVRIDQEGATHDDARQLAYEQARAILARLDVVHSGRLLAANPITEVGNKPNKLSFNMHHFRANQDPEITLNLEELFVPVPTQCQDLGVDIKAFALSLSAAGGTSAEIYRDVDIPEARGCPMGYGLSDLIVYRPFSEPVAMVVLVNVFRYGFEGPDRRFIAIPVPVP